MFYVLHSTTDTDKMLEEQGESGTYTPSQGCTDRRKSSRECPTHGYALSYGKETPGHDIADTSLYDRGKRTYKFQFVCMRR
jgi:hypothetical protein